MRSETWLAKLVFALGALVMIATSPPPTWHASKELEAELESEGEGDDKLLRIRVRMMDGVARDARRILVGVTGSVDRPASDLTITWLNDRGDAIISTPFSTDDDFLTVYTTTQNWELCPDDDVCEVVFEGLIVAESSAAYAMDLAVEVTVSGSKDKKPRGEIEASVEVLDAP